MNISLGFSTCPNDTFMFDAIVNRRIAIQGLEFDVHMADIFHLNQMAIAGQLDMIKISYNTYGSILDRYTLLDAGSALGHNCGPLLISKRPLTVQQIADQNLLVAIPGKNTTANLLLGFYAPEIQYKQEMIFHEIMPAILAGQVDAGLIIHENRFTYQNMGLRLIRDLGEYWEAKTSLPIPLGAIVVRTDLGEHVIHKLQKIMHDSVAYAFAHRDDSLPFVREYAQEMDESVMHAHIDLYVNEYSLSLGKKGKQAVKKVLEVGKSMGLYKTNA